MIFTENEITELNQAIEKAEGKTTAEIVPVVVRTSDDYPGARWRLTIAFALLCALLLHYFFPELETLTILWSFAPTLAIGYLLGGSSFLLRRFMSNSKIEQEVMQRAFQAFYENGLGTTVNNTGVLIFITLTEHKVVVLADKTINDKVENGTWDEIVSELTAEIRSKNLTEGLKTSISHVGEILTQYFPGDDTNQNELPNTVRIEE